MKKNEQKQVKKSDEECPLCQVSEETLEKLQKRGSAQKSLEKSSKKKKGFWQKVSKNNEESRNRNQK